MGISDQPDAYSWTVPHVMSTDELRRVADEYVAIAERLKRCGFGGVELHGAHGYLITQILSPWSNRRTDRYGGSLENRMRFVREVARGHPADLRRRLRHRPEDAGRRRRRRRHRSGRGGAHHGALARRRDARLLRLQPGQLHAQPGEPRAGHAFPARAFPRHPQEGPARRGRHARDGDRPHRDAGGSRGRDRRRRRRPRRTDARA